MEFKTIPTIEDYEISETGLVRRKDNGYIVKSRIGMVGYYCVTLHHVPYNIHRLLMITWRPQPNNKLQVNHIDGNRLNNSLDNLEWVTQEDNLKHGYANGLMRHKTKTLNGINRIDKEGNVKKYNNFKEVESDGFRRSNVSDCIYNKRGCSKTHKGYRWEV